MEYVSLPQVVRQGYIDSSEEGFWHRSICQGDPMTKNNGPRFSDSKEFDSLHDEIMLAAIHNPGKYIKHVLLTTPAYVFSSGINFSRTDVLDMANKGIYEYSIKAEEEYYGNFPDLIISLSIPVRHILSIENLSGIFTLQNIGHIRFKASCKICKKDVLESFSLDLSNNEKLKGMFSSPDLREAVDRYIWDKAWKTANSMRGDISPSICFMHKLFFLIEIKSHVKSFGETLRQLRIYDNAAATHSMPLSQFQEYSFLTSGATRYIGTYLLTPDLRFKQEFESQGFHVITYESEKKNTSSLDSFNVSLASRYDEFAGGKP